MPTVDSQDTRNKWHSYSECLDDCCREKTYPTINVVTRSGTTTQVQNKGKQHDEAWVRKTPGKIPSFDVGREKGTFMEAKKDFSDPRTSVATMQQQLQFQEALSDQVSTLTSFLQSCMKLLRNQNALNELQKFIQSCKP